jgi:hypothetical protein
MTFPPDALPERVLSALAAGRKIEAIKALREATGMGLKDANDAVERHLRDDPGLRSRYESASAASGAVWVRRVLILAIVVAAYLYFRSR